MNADSKPFFTLRRTEDGDLAIKTSVLGVVSGIIFIIGTVGGSGYFREGKYTDDMAASDLRELEVRISKEVRKLLREQYLQKDEYREKHADMKAVVNNIMEDDEKIILDIRQLYSLIAKLPPQDLQNKVSSNESRITHIESEHDWIIDQIRLFYTPKLHGKSDATLLSHE